MLCQIILLTELMNIYLEMACDRLMPSYNGILTVSCIRTLAHIALKLSGFVPLVSVFSTLLRLLSLLAGYHLLYVVLFYRTVSLNC